MSTIPISASIEPLMFPLNWDHVPPSHTSLQYAVSGRLHCPFRRSWPAGSSGGLHPVAVSSLSDRAAGALQREAPYRDGSRASCPVHCAAGGDQSQSATPRRGSGNTVASVEGSANVSRFVPGMTAVSIVHRMAVVFASGPIRAIVSLLHALWLLIQARVN